MVAAKLVVQRRHQRRFQFAIGDTAGNYRGCRNMAAIRFRKETLVVPFDIHRSHGFTQTFCQDQIDVQRWIFNRYFVTTTAAIRQSSPLGIIILLRWQPGGTGLALQRQLLIGEPALGARPDQIKGFVEFRGIVGGNCCRRRIAVLFRRPLSLEHAVISNGISTNATRYFIIHPSIHQIRRC